MQKPKMAEDENFPTPIPSPTPEAMMKEGMSDWETYTDDELGINFKYPSEWQKLSQVGGVFIEAPNKRTKVLVVGKERNGMSPEEAIHDYLENYTSYGDQSLTYANESAVTINSLEGWRADIQISALNQNDIIFYLSDPNNAKMYQGLWFTDVTDDLITQIDQILSTFQFTN
jgi:hypothetical protein